MRSDGGRALLGSRSVVKCFISSPSPVMLKQSSGWEAAAFAGKETEVNPNLVPVRKKAPVEVCPPLNQMHDPELSQSCAYQSV